MSDMKTCEFKDLDRNEIRVQFSGGGNIRVYVKARGEVESEKTTCLHLTHTQARILCLAIEDLLEVADE